MNTPVNPTTNVAYRVLDALGFGADPERARLVLASWCRPVRRLSVAECREVLAVVASAAARVPTQRGEHQYDRDPEPGTEGTGRPWRGARYSEPDGDDL